MSTLQPRSGDEEREALEHGAELALVGGRPTTLRDRHGTEWARLAWTDGDGATVLARARLRRPDGGAVELAPRAGVDPLLGLVDHLMSNDRVARAAATAWAAPAGIPALDRPAALAPGAGSAVLDLLARLAARAGRFALRYRGPYPTDALWDSLQASFRPVGEPAAARAAFTRDALAAAVTGAMREVAVDLAPAPFVREQVGGGVVAQLRDGVEALWVDGRCYAAAAGDGRRLEERGDRWLAVLRIGGAPWAEVAALAADRGAVERGEPPPPCPPERPLDDRLRRGLLALAVVDAPAALGAALRGLDPPVWLGDPGLALAARRGDGIVVHAALIDRLDGEALVRGLAEALAPVARALAAEVLADALAAGR